MTASMPESILSPRPVRNLDSSGTTVDRDKSSTWVITSSTGVLSRTFPV